MIIQVSNGENHHHNQGDIEGPDQIILYLYDDTLSIMIIKDNDKIKYHLILYVSIIIMIYLSESYVS